MRKHMSQNAASAVTNQRHAGPGLAAFAGITALPEMPHASHLVPLLATHEFQESFKNLRDLQFLDGNLSQWVDNLGAFSDMLDNRRRAFASKLPAVRANTGATDIAALQTRRDALAGELAQAESESDAAAFANPRERDLLTRLANGQTTVAQSQALPAELRAQIELGDAADRLRRAQGALTWQLSQEFTARAWEAKKALRGTDAGLGTARERDAALAQAQRDEPARHERFAARIAELTQRLQGLRPAVAVAQREQQKQLQDIAVAELERQQERLTTYTAQARLAIAQIQDRAQFARSSDAAPGETPK